ncbi:MAG: hypothetical protein Q8O86_10040 [Dehalococcoidia bacterium]|nr:hypothetical protein [Dehalococcoidia bacterium]
MAVRSRVLRPAIPGGSSASVYAQEGRTVLAIDADPDANLASALGFSPEAFSQSTPGVVADRCVRPPPYLWRTGPSAATGNLPVSEMVESLERYMERS